jgi:hypothetical protein
MNRFNLRKLNKIERIVQHQIEIGSQLWKTYTLGWILIELGKQLEKIYKFQPKTA